MNRRARSFHLPWDTGESGSHLLCHTNSLAYQSAHGQPLAGSWVLVPRGSRCYNLYCGNPPGRYRRFSIEPSMAQPTPNRSRSHFLTCFPSGPKIRCRLGNSSTKVLFRHPTEPSTFVLHAAASASLLFTTGGQLFLRARNPLLEIGDVTT